MKRSFSFSGLMAVVMPMALLAGCGGGSGGDDTILSAGAGGAVGVESIALTASSQTLNSSATGQTKITIQAVVKGTGNAVLASIPVAFATSSGAIAATQPTTDDTGTAIAALSNGSDASNRTITVTATAGGASGTVSVQVIGTTLKISGPPALALADSAEYTIELQDSQGAGIATGVTVSSANGNTLSTTSVQTGVSGQGVVTVTADSPGADTLTAAAIGMTESTAINVSGDIFAIQTPVQDAELALNSNIPVTVLWTQNGTPKAGETITFSSTRGSFVGGTNTAVTDGAGQATVQVTSSSSGPVTLSAVNPDLTSTSVAAEFVADTAASLTLQANPQTVAVNNQSTLSVIVRDPTGNPVKNKIVSFVIEQDNTGNSYLSVGSAVTDSQGRASAVYTAGGLPSAANGVVLRSTVQDTPAVTSTVALTVAGRAIDMAIGTGAELFEPTSSLYSQEWAIIVTDTSGTAPEPVANTNVQAKIRSNSYFKGFLALADDGSGDLDWVPNYSVGPPAGCADEDTNQDGFLGAGEDLNGNGTMEAGNRATVTALAPGASADACSQIGSLGGPSTVVETDDNGIARVCVVYLQSDNLWVNVKLSSLLTVTGTEYAESQNFTLPALAEDLDDENSNPAGQFSPFGQAASCADPN